MNEKKLAYHRDYYRKNKEKILKRQKEKRSPENRLKKVLEKARNINNI
jgi:hypothetical protein